jgi:hypothetical protein
MPLLESRRVLGPVRTPMAQIDGIPRDRRTVLFAVSPDASTQSVDDDLLVLGGTPAVKPTALHLYVLQASGGGANG